MIIANPRARRLRPVLLDQLVEAWAPAGRVRLLLTESATSAATQAAEAAAAGAGLVVAVGGDGTVNQVAAGLVGGPTALAVCPAGTTDVFARALGLPRSTLAAARLLAARAGRVEPATISVGEANGVVFLANAGIGLDAAVVARVEARPRLKRTLGQGWFLAAAIVETLHRRRGPTLALAVEGGPSATSGLVVALRTGPYTYLGRRPVALSPGTAGLRDELEIVWSTSTRPLAVVRAGLSAITRAERPRRGIDHAPGPRGATVHSDEPVPLQVDGELVGWATDIALRQRNLCLRVLRA